MTIKKWLLASLAVLLFAGAPVAEAETGSTTNSASYVDIQGHWAEQEIMALTAAGALKGERTFRPDEPVTRAEMIVLFLAAKGIVPTSSNTSPFSDVPLDHWFAPYAETAYRLGFVHGITSNGKRYFRPNDPVERQELVSVLLRAKGDSGAVNQFLWSTAIKTLQPYPDDDQVVKENQRALAYALSQQMVSPYQDGMLKPIQIMTRAEAAVYASRHLLVRNKAEQLPRIPELNIPYKQVLQVESTAYHFSNGYTLSYLGWPLRVGLVAVDPQVIPLGTHLYIEGYGYAVAADIGGAVKQHHVDVFLPSLEAALAYGRQKDTKVYILP